MKNIAINGLGRIGRLCFREIIEHSDLNIIAVNTPADNKVLAHLIKYDSIHGTWKHDISYDNDYLLIGEKKVKTFHITDINKIKWENIHTVIECSGKFTSKMLASSHINNGAKKVLISAPCVDADITIIMGVNHISLTKEYNIISAGSCTTNALIPIVKILNDNFGIISGYVTTVHSYTSDQNLVDSAHKDLRRARGATTAIIPTKTGAALGIKLVLPELGDKITGSAIRVPTSNVSLIDLSCLIARDTSKDEINNLMISNSKNSKILSVTHAPLVSVDYNHSTYSAIFDLFETYVINSNFIRVLAWYDNEWAFVQRMIDIVNIM